MDDQKTKKSPQSNPDAVQQAADYETAISCTGFGKFNILLLVIGIPAGWTSMLESSTMSYVFPAAQCYLELSLQDKGLLNAATYIGMICSAFFWGVLADNWGRKKLLVLGYLLDGAFIILSGFSQSFEMLFVCKLFGGFMLAHFSINGPLAAFVSYIAEFHSSKHRTRIIIVRGMIVHSAKFVLPLLAWAVFPLDLYYSFFNGNIVLHSWNIFLFLCSIPSLLSGFAYIFMPETPKFLMAKGETEKAMEVFSWVYSLNTGKSPDSYPVKCLIAEKTNVDSSDAGKSKFYAALKQTGQLFSSDYRWIALLLCAIEIGVVFSGNPIRLWLPQIFTTINNYHNTYNDTSASLCQMLETIDSSTSEETKILRTCEVNMSGNFLYLNTLIVAIVCLVGFFISITVINIFKKKPFLITQALCCGIFIATMYFSKSTAATLALSSVAVTQYNICVSLIHSFTVDLFPTGLRTLMIAVAMSASRVAAVIGNIIFPVVLESGCLQTFLVFGSTAMVSGLLAMLLPNTHLTALE